jgi:hypothetical protein
MSLEAIPPPTRISPLLFSILVLSTAREPALILEVHDHDQTRVASDEKSAIESAAACASSSRLVLELQKSGSSSTRLPFGLGRSSAERTA